MIVLSQDRRVIPSFTVSPGSSRTEWQEILAEEAMLDGVSGLNTPGAHEEQTGMEATCAFAELATLRRYAIR